MRPRYELVGLYAKCGFRFLKATHEPGEDAWLIVGDRTLALFEWPVNYFAIKSKSRILVVKAEPRIGPSRLVRWSDEAFGIQWPLSSEDSAQLFGEIAKLWLSSK